MDGSGNNSKGSVAGLPLEKKFRCGYLKDSTEQLRVGLVLLLVLCLLACLDDVSGPVDIFRYMPLPGVMLAIILVILLSVAYTDFFIRHYCLIISFVLLLVCIAIPYSFFERYKQYGGDESFLMVVMTVLIFWIYGFSRLGLICSSQWGCLSAAMYIALTLSLHQIDQLNLLIDIIILIVVNVAGMTCSYDNERYARLLFYEKPGINKLF